MEELNGQSRHLTLGQINLTFHSFSHIPSFHVDDTTNFHTYYKDLFGD